MGIIRWLKRLFGGAAERPRPAPAPHGEPPALQAADLLALARDLQSRDAQWPEIWATLNPGDHPAVRQLLLDLRNDGLQFAPADGLRKIELACESLSPTADAVAVLQKVLGRTDVLDTFR